MRFDLWYCDDNKEDCSKSSRNYFHDSDNLGGVDNTPCMQRLNLLPFGLSRWGF